MNFPGNAYEQDEAFQAVLIEHREGALQVPEVLAMATKEVVFQDVQDHSSPCQDWRGSGATQVPLGLRKDIVQEKVKSNSHSEPWTRNEENYKEYFRRRLRCRK